MANPFDNILGDFGDNSDLIDVSLESALATFEEAVAQEDETPLLPNDGDANDMGEPIAPIAASRRSRNLSSIFADEDEDGEGDADDDDDEDKETSSRRKRRKHKNYDSFFADDDDKDDDEEDEDEKDDEEAETKAKRRKHRNLAAFSEAADETADADGNVDEGLESFIALSGQLDGVEQELESLGMEAFNIFGDSLSATPSITADNLRKWKFDAKLNLEQM